MIDVEKKWKLWIKMKNDSFSWKVSSVERFDVM
jgi:hypothetical protein